jgi:hypothetical protein
MDDYCNTAKVTLYKGGPDQNLWKSPSSFNIKEPKVKKGRKKLRFTYGL